jgi:hypothetical protein
VSGGDHDATLEGRDSGPLDGAGLADVVEQAFDYRGDVTLVLDDGRQLEGYLFNRNRDVPQPFVQMLGCRGGDPITVPFAQIRAIRFTGRDTAAGNSYAAWLRRREAARADTGG